MSRTVLTGAAAELQAAFPHVPVTAGHGAGEWLAPVPLGELPAVAGWVYAQLGAPLAQAVGVDERPLAGQFRLYYVFSVPDYRQWLVLRADVDPLAPSFPSVTPAVPAAHWYEREIQDMLGLTAAGHPDPRPLVLHAGWPHGTHPLRKDFDGARMPARAPAPAPTGFHGVAGDGTAEVPVGPIHAGIIEPGHFRISTLGEDVLRLEAQLFYTHRGLEKRAEGMTVERGLYLAERICGACALSNAVAYAQAVERLTGAEVPPRAQVLRAVGLELERLYNHVGDLGNLCAGAAALLGNMHLLRLKEQLQRLNEAVVGHRFLRGFAALGGVRRDVGEGALVNLLGVLDQVRSQFLGALDLLAGNGVFQDRMRTTGVLRRDVAEQLGVVGVAARASGIGRDLRRDHPYLVYGGLDVPVPVYPQGDVWARFQVRAEEALASFRLIADLAEQLPAGPVQADIGPVPPLRHAIGWVESPRGANLHFVMTGPDSTIYRYMVRTASYPNWAAVPSTLPGNLVPDFPLINKSFELCYACLDR